MDISNSRQRPEEQDRIAAILALIPAGRKVLDVGARDGYISRLLIRSFEQVTALDLKKPQIADDSITAVAGDVTCLDFADDEFDTVVCAEVLEHIPSHLLQKACNEIIRVARKHVIIGVPYKQDIRVGRTKCSACGRRNPPYGHVNVFDEKRLRQLFRSLTVERISFVGHNNSRTNFLSVLFMDLAGNPFGKYHQEESCVFCGAKLSAPARITVTQQAFSKVASIIRRIQCRFISPHPNWIHVHFVKKGSYPNSDGTAAVSTI